MTSVKLISSFEWKQVQAGSALQKDTPSPLSPQPGSLSSTGPPAPPTGSAEFPTLQESSRIIQGKSPVAVVHAGETSRPFPSTYSTTTTAHVAGQQGLGTDTAPEASDVQKHDRAKHELIDYDAQEAAKAHGGDKSLQQKVKEALEGNVQALEESAKETAEKSRSFLQGK